MLPTSPQFAGELDARIKAFSESLRELDSRAERLSAADRPSPTTPDDTAATLDLLRLQREELLVASEELREQSEELSRTSGLLRDERVRGRIVFDLAPEARFVTDEFAVLHNANPAAADLLGVDGRFLRGKPLVAFIERDDVGRFRQALTQLASMEGSLEVALTLVRRDGERAAVTLVGTGAHETRLVFWSVRASPGAAVDQAPQVLEEHERLIEDAQRQCAEFASFQQERDLSMAVLAHELRGPTSTILGWARLLRHPRIDPGPRERALAVIEENALLQLALVDDLLDSSRLAANKVELTKVPVDLGEVVGWAVESAQSRAAEQRIALTSDVPAACPVEGDARRLLQVITNLLTNALKFTPVGGAVSVRVTVGDGLATLRVADTGVGIAPAQLPQVFERFHQGAHKSESAGGLGLGLFVVREIVQMHGGSVTAASPGEDLGAVFTVTLPLADGTAASAGPHRR